MSETKTSPCMPSWYVQGQLYVYQKWTSGKYQKWITILANKCTLQYNT